MRNVFNYLYGNLLQMKVTDDRAGVTDIVFFLNAFFIVKFRSFRFENQQSPAIELETELFFSFNE